MTRTILTAALALAIAAPATADTLSDQVRRHFATSYDGNDAQRVIDPDSRVTDRALAIHAQLRAAEDENTAPVKLGGAASTRDATNPRAQAIFDQLRATDDDSNS